VSAFLIGAPTTPTAPRQTTRPGPSAIGVAAGRRGLGGLILPGFSPALSTTEISAGLPISLRRFLRSPCATANSTGYVLSAPMMIQTTRSVWS
jgi:hypothetical protein